MFEFFRKARKNVGFAENINLDKITVNKLPTTQIVFTEPEEVIDDSDEVMEIQDEAKIVVRGPGSVGLGVGSGGSSKWIEISDGDDNDMSENETNMKESKSVLAPTKNNVQNDKGKLFYSICFIL